MPNKSTWVSPTAVALFPTSTCNTWGCWGTGRHRTHTVPLGTTEQTPPSKGTQPPPGTTSRVRPCLILLYHRIFCWLRKSRFLLDTVRLETAPNAISLAAVINHTLQDCSRFHVRKFSNVLTPVWGAHPSAGFYWLPGI